MYKRRAHVVFFAADELLTEKALRSARALATDWIEARSYVPPLTDCDLFITLDAGGLSHLPRLPQGVRHKHWSLAPDAVDQDIEARVQGLIGGMRLLARLDGSPAPPH